MVHRRARIFVAVVSLLGCVFIMKADYAFAASGEFSLQISPSPLVLTLKPGQTNTVDLKVRNMGVKSEDLAIVPRSFKINTDESVVFNDTQAPEEANWLSFDKPTFTIEPGQVVTEKIAITVPKDAGFSYAFSLIIHRRQEPVITGEAGKQVKGSIALFTLLNVDRPGAVRKLSIDKFNTSQQVYEFLPASFNLTLRNTGNTIVQPAGNIFVQRNSQDQTPISALPVNQAAGYILPGTVRTLTAQWSDGFQVLHTTTDASGVSKQDLSWNWDNLSHIAIGRYTAKVVAIYNDGVRDVPIMGEVTFWVIPWRLLLGAFIVFLLIAAGLWSILRMIFRPKRKRHIRF